MKMDKVAGSQNDEFFTPKYAVDAIVPHLKAKGFSKIWCPFDKDESFFVRVLRNEGFKVFATHLETHGDFFELACDIAPQADAIVSNPPYSIKAEVFEALFKTGKPFAMLVGVVGLFESEKRFTLFGENEFEVLYLNRRVSYFRDLSDDKPALSPPFSSVYLTSQILPKQICFARVNKKNLKPMNQNRYGQHIRTLNGHYTVVERGTPDDGRYKALHHASNRVFLLPGGTLKLEDLRNQRGDHIPEAEAAECDRNTVAFEGIDLATYYERTAE